MDINAEFRPCQTIIKSHFFHSQIELRKFIHNFTQNTSRTDMGKLNTDLKQESARSYIA